MAIAHETARSMPVMTLRRNFSWTFIGNVIYAACQWGMLMALAKLGTPEMVGQYALGLAVGAPVFMLTNLQLRAIQATDAQSDFNFVDYRSLRLIATGIGMAVVTTFALAMANSSTTALVVVLVGVAKSSESISDIYYGFAQRHERMDVVAKLLIIRGLLSLFVMVVILYVSANIIVALASVALCWLAITLFLDSRIARFGTRSDNRIHKSGFTLSESKRLLVLALPLGFVMMVISLNTNIPRYLIQYHFDERELGFYAALTYLIVAGTTIVGALGQAASPRLANYFAESNQAQFISLFRRLVILVALVGIGGVAIAVTAGETILRILYTSEYAHLKGVLVVVMIAGAASYLRSLIGYAMTATRSFIQQSRISLLSLIIVAVSSLVLVPQSGLYGGAVAVALAATVQCICGVFVIRRAINSQNVP